MNYITFKTDKHIETDELDFVLRTEILKTNDWEDDYPNEIHLGVMPYADAYPINIDSILDILNEYKNFGYNYVSIDYNSDHISYIINPQKIYKSTEDEISEYNKRNKINGKNRKGI